jgi:hypothetical protein
MVESGEWDVEMTMNGDLANLSAKHGQMSHFGSKQHTMGLNTLERRG